MQSVNFNLYNFHLKTARTKWQIKTSFMVCSCYWVRNKSVFDGFFDLHESSPVWFLFSLLLYFISNCGLVHKVLDRERNHPIKMWWNLAIWHYDSMCKWRIILLVCSQFLQVNKQNKKQMLYKWLHLLSQCKDFTVHNTCFIMLFKAINILRVK